MSRTNFERIKEMTADELAGALDVMIADGLDYALGFPRDCCTEKCECEPCIKEWLEREVKE